MVWDGRIWEYLCQLRWTWQDSKVTELPAILWQRGWLWKRCWTGHGALLCVYMGVSENNGTPKSSTLIGFSIINHPFWGPTIFGNTHIFVDMYYVYMYIWYVFTYIHLFSDMHRWMDRWSLLRSFFVVNGLCVLRSLCIYFFSIYHCRRG